MNRRSPSSTRWATSLTLVAFVLAMQHGCGHWRSAHGVEDLPAVGDTLRLRRGDEQRTVRVVRMQYPRVEGVEDAPQGPGAVVLDLTTFDEVEVYDYVRGVALTSLATAGVGALLFAASAGIYCASIKCLPSD
jgi:hypothetical protein